MWFSYANVEARAEHSKWTITGRDGFSGIDKEKTDCNVATEDYFEKNGMENVST